MGARRATKQQRSRKGWWIVLAAVAALVTAGVVGIGLRSGTPVPEVAPTPSATPTPTPTPVRDVDLSGLPIPRARFCDLIGDAAIPEALGGAITQQSHYDPGQRVELAPGVKDISHEYGCTFDGVSGAQARAWVFAAPTRPATAGAIAHELARRPGCLTVRGGPTYGRPTVTTRCRVPGPATQVTLSGLFGDAWFSCQLTTPGGSAVRAERRAERWCVHVATTLGARP